MMCIMVVEWQRQKKINQNENESTIFNLYRSLTLFTKDKTSGLPHEVQGVAANLCYLQRSRVGKELDFHNPKYIELNKITGLRALLHEFCLAHTCLMHNSQVHHFRYDMSAH